MRFLNFVEPVIPEADSVSGGFPALEKAVPEKHKILEAIEFAADVHSRQFRRGSGVPFIVHPLGVAILLLEQAMPQNVIIAGLLHDVLEKTQAKEKDIRIRFGEEVLNLVQYLTITGQQGHPLLRREKKIESLKIMPQYALIIACAESLDHVRTWLEGYGSSESLRKGLAGLHDWREQRRYYEDQARIFLSRKREMKGCSLPDEFNRDLNTLFGVLE